VPHQIIWSSYIGRSWVGCNSLPINGHCTNHPTSV